MNDKLDNQINNILIKLDKTNEKFDNILNFDIESQISKFQEMKIFRKEEQMTKSKQNLII